MSKYELSRREFVRKLGAATVGSGFVFSAFAGCHMTASQRAEATEAMVDKLGKVPKTPLGTRMGNFAVSRIVMSQDWSSDLYAAGLAAGINYVHKAGYWSSLPDEFKKRPRESYMTDITVDSTPNNPDDEDSAYSQVTESLQRNGLQYYDIFKAHYGWKSVGEMKTKRGTHRAFARLKKEGKVKYFGVSQHDFVAYPEIIAAEIQEGLIDTMQVFYSYGTGSATQQIFDAAHKAGVGMVAMKIYANGHGRMAGDDARQAEMKAPGMVGRSLIRHVLGVQGSDGKPIFDTCVSSLQNFDQFEENVGALASRVAAADSFQFA